MLPPRSAGILLHPTALPGAPSLGAPARAFVDFLAAAGCRWWQVLPLGPPDSFGSPYASPGVLAGDLRLLDRTDGSADNAAFARQLQDSGYGDSGAFHDFCATQSWWLDDFVLYTVLAAQHGPNWTAWPKELARHEDVALKACADLFGAELERSRLLQWAFWQQWQALRDYAASRGVGFIGDLPIYPAHASADVWGNQHCFLLTRQGLPQAVAGCPPDPFCSAGQKWGNPLYAWDRLAASDFAWFRRRLDLLLSRYDLLRLDHFIGYQEFWAIPPRAAAAAGNWQPGPGERLFNLLATDHPQLPFIAEDLGSVSAAVAALRDRFALPGTRVLTFGLTGAPPDPHQPHTYPELAVACTGTHDTMTLQGWLDCLPRQEHRGLCDRFAAAPDALAWRLISLVADSRAALAIYPLQDLLGLGEATRFNRPGTTAGNWRWQAGTADCCAGLASRLRELLIHTNRFSEDLSPCSLPSRLSAAAP